MSDNLMTARGLKLGDKVTKFLLHYANTPMQYIAIFYGCKIVKFQMKNYNIFLSLL